MKRGTIVFIVIGVIATILIPFLINWLVASNAPTWLSPIAGSSDTEVAWIGFWANYIGSIIATCVAFIVLYKTLRQNELENQLNRKDAHSENMENSERQVKQLSYEVARQHLSEIRNTLVDCFMAMEQEKSNDLFWVLKKEDIFDLDLDEQRNSIAKVVDDENRAFYKLELLYPKSGRNEEVNRIMNDIRRYSVESHMCLSDLLWLAQFYTDSSIDLTNQAEIGDMVQERKAKKPRSRLSKESYYTVDEFIITNSLFDFSFNKDKILTAWQTGRDIVNTLLLDSLNELNEYQTKAVESILN